MAAPATDRSIFERLRAGLGLTGRDIDPAGLVAFRVLYGLLATVGAVRFVANGWVERFFGEPTFFFRYWGFEWVPVPSVPVVYALYAVMGLAGLGIALGWRYRLSVALHLVTFLWVELIDVTNYLNHYHLWVLLGLLLLVLPLHRYASLDVRAGRARERVRFPLAWARAFQLQVGLVYVFAGLAKANTDWLVHGQPLQIWLAARQDFPLLGPLFGEPGVALAMSWAGFLHDLCVPFLLLWGRTRAWAYAALCTFHLATHLLFDIGMFPFIMTLAATTFLGPSWPRRVVAPVSRWLGSWRRRSKIEHLEDRAFWRPRRFMVGLACVWFAVQALVPLRAHLYGGDVSWHEQGMRWSWRVMVREKNGSIHYRVRVEGRERELHVPPSRYLTAHQEREMSGQPDLILQLAHHIAADFRARGHRGVEVYVDALVSLNGRPMARLIDPTVDLARVEDGLMAAAWILPRPDLPPIELRPLQLPLADNRDPR